MRDRHVIAPLDTGLEFYRQVLDLRAIASRLLTADIANASTPGFKAIDLDFREALTNAQSGGNPSGPAWLVDDPQHLNRADRPVLPRPPRNAVKYQIGAPRDIGWEQCGS